MSRFKDQVAVITGGGQGIGLGIAKRMGGEGAKVVLVDLNTEALSAASKSLESEGITNHGISADITDEDQVQKAVQEVIDKFGQVDVLVTAAGITGKTNLNTHLVDPADFDNVLRINVRGMFLC